MEAEAVMRGKRGVLSRVKIKAEWEVLRFRQREEGTAWDKPHGWGSTSLGLCSKSESSFQRHHRSNYHLSGAHKDTVSGAFILVHVIFFHAVVLIIILSDRYSVIYNWKSATQEGEELV